MPHAERLEPFRLAAKEQDKLDGEGDEKNDDERIAKSFQKFFDKTLGRNLRKFVAAELLSACCGFRLRETRKLVRGHKLIRFGLTV